MPHEAMRKLFSVSLVAALCLTLGWGSVLSGVSHCLGGIEGILGAGDAEAFSVPAAAQTQTLTVVSFKKRVPSMWVVLSEDESFPLAKLNPNQGICFSEIEGLAAGDYKLRLMVGASLEVFCLEFKIIEGQDLTLLLVTNHYEDGPEVRAIPLQGSLRPLQ